MNFPTYRLKIKTESLSKQTAFVRMVSYQNCCSSFVIVGPPPPSFLPPSVFKKIKTIGKIGKENIKKIMSGVI